ncbi:trigger factor [Elongatibacter sediminis]|uniref:Trigger factor n=1 Tax=Elongatibacter sediminis TaxID=3119006 RepID=A0AAW9REJ7_9GAMM
MEVSVENTGGLQRRLTVQIPGSEIDQKVDSRLKELSKQVKIKGFRPGRVPMSVVRQRYGKQVRLEIASEAMQNGLQQAIRDENLRPASSPQVDDAPDVQQQGDLQFSAVLEVYPEIDHVDVSGMEFEKPEAEVAESDIDEMLQTLREQRRTFEPVERSPQNDDQVAFEYVAETDEGRVPEEGHQRLALIMGQSGFEELESALAGLESGASTETELEFPEAFREPALAGKKAKVELKLDQVAEPRLPEVDEAFIRGFGVEDGTEASLRDEIRANLERELRQATLSIMKVKIINTLMDHLPDLEVPAGLVDQEANSMAARVAAQEGREPSADEASAFAEPAKSRVRGGLIMGEIARQNALRIDNTRVRSAIETIAQTYENPAEVLQLYYGNPQLMAQVENSVLEEQVVDWVLENAKVSATATPFKDVIAEASNLSR